MKLRAMGTTGKIAVLGLVWGLAVVVAGVPDGLAKKRETYVLVTGSGAGAYWVRCRRGATAAARELGVKVRFDGPVMSDSARQIEIIEGWIAERVTGIAVSAGDPCGIEEVIKKAVRRDIPVVTFDSDSPGSERHMYIGTENREAGRVAGRALVKALDGKGKVAVLHGGVTSLNFRKRLEGLREVLDAEKDIEIVALEDNRDDEALAVAQAENMLHKYPKLDAFVATSSVGALSAVAALRSRGRAGRVKVVGFDLDRENVKSIQRGWVTAIVEQRPDRMGELSIRWLRRLSRGERPPSRKLDTGVEVVTRENVAKAAERL